MDKPILSNSYSLQCNTRGNPLPRLNWSKNNRTSEYYPSVKQCKTPCRIYSIQNKYKINRNQFLFDHHSFQISIDSIFPIIDTE